MRVDVARLYQAMPAVVAQEPLATDVTEDDGEGHVPAELRQWLVRLRLLETVPFAYLIADSDLLPPESIRWFFVDRRWTDALVQGALAVGTLNSDDRTALTALYPAVRRELDREERNVRRRPDSDRLSGAVAPISGFLLRSRAVSGWPGLHVRAYREDPRQYGVADTDPVPDSIDEVRLLRLERLAPAVLLCLFDGVPQAVHVEEPRAGVQFGMDGSWTAAGYSARLTARNATTFADIPGAPPVTVPFRAGGAAGVVDIQALQRTLSSPPYGATGAGDGLDSAEYAMQLIRFPHRQIFAANPGA